MILLIAFLVQTFAYWIGFTSWDFYINRKYVSNEKLFQDLIADQPDWTKPLLLRELRRIDRQKHRDKYTTDSKYYSKILLWFGGIYMLTCVLCLVMAVLDMFGVIKL